MMKSISASCRDFSLSGFGIAKLTGNVKLPLIPGLNFQ
jgi:hypothetical protein